MTTTLTRIQSADFANQAVQLYEAAFPPEERRPTHDWLALMNGNASPFTVHAITNAEGVFCGFITTWHFDAFIYVEHFAVEPRWRGHGIGSKALQNLKEQSAGKPIVLEVEPPVVETACRRIRFYERNGFFLQSIPYTQPAYSPHLPSIELRLMSTTADLPQADLRCAIRVIHRNVYGIC